MEMTSGDWLSVAELNFSQAEEAAIEKDGRYEAHCFRKAEIAALLAIAMHLQERNAE